MPSEFDLRQRYWSDPWQNPMDNWTNLLFRQSMEKPTIPIPDLPTAPQEKIESPLKSTIDEVEVGPSFSEKFQGGLLGKNASAINKGLDALGGIANSLPGAANTYNGPKGNVRAAIDSGYNAIADAAANFGPYGQMVSMGMKAANMLNGIQGAIFGATDGMTTTDAIMDSPLGFLTGVGWVNLAFGQKSDTITKNEEAFAAVGASYGGTESAVGDALDKSGKKYGAFSNGARLDANREIAEATRQQKIMSGIADKAMNRFAIRDAMSSIAGNRRAFDLLGGYKQQAVHFGRDGMVIAKRVASRYKMNKREAQEFKEGGALDNNSVIFEVDIDSLPEEFKDGGVLGSSIIKEIEVEEMVEEFKEGGAFNVIPEGALHARLHHMENAENLTKKGIPVVSEKEGELEQHAEIEKEEIILRLSLTKRLEELAKEDTDEAALEAGKLLVEEILNNTIDNTNTLL